MFSNYGGIKLELNKWRKRGKYINIGHLNITFPTRLWLNEELRRKNFKYLTLNKNGNRTYKNLWNPVKAMLERKCVGAKANTGKEGKSKPSKLNFLHNLVAKEHIKLTVIYLVWFGGYTGVSMDQTHQNLHLKLVFVIQRKLWLNTVYLENNNKGSHELSTDHTEVMEA